MTAPPTSPLRPSLAAAVLTCTALLASACGGSSGSAKPGTGQTEAQLEAKFAACLRSHGLPNAYPAPPANGPSSAPGLNFHGIDVGGVSPDSPALQQALTACQHILPGSTPESASQLRKQLAAALKAVSCLRSHGFPGFPDPSQQDGALNWQPPPGSIDTSSPQFIAARKTCGKIIPPFGAP